MFYQFYFCIKHKGETWPINTWPWPQGKGLIKLHKSKNIQMFLLSCLQQLSMLFHWTVLKVSTIPQVSTVQLQTVMGSRWLNHFLSSFLLSLLSNQRFVDVRNHTAPSYGSFDERIQLFITSDCKLQVTWSDALHFEILGSITCQLQHLSREVLQNGGTVHSSSGSHPSMACGASLQVSVDPAHRKLKKRRLSCWGALQCLSITEGLPLLWANLLGS